MEQSFKSGERTWVGSGGPWEQEYGYARAVRVGPFAYVSGTTAASPDGAHCDMDLTGQTICVIDKIRTALEQLGFTMADVVRTRTYVADISAWAEVASIHRRYFGLIMPCATMVEAAALIRPDLLVEMDVDAIQGSNDKLIP